MLLYFFQGVKSSRPVAVAQAKFNSKSKFHPLTGLPLQSSPVSTDTIFSVDVYLPMVLGGRQAHSLVSLGLCDEKGCIKLKSFCSFFFFSR